MILQVLILLQEICKEFGRNRLQITKYTKYFKHVIKKFPFLINNLLLNLKINLFSLLTI